MDRGPREGDPLTRSAESHGRFNRSNGEGFAKVANDRGFEPEELYFNLVEYNDISQDFHDSDELATANIEDIEWADIDWATVEIIYPDGHIEYRHFVGDWEDLDAFYDAMIDWSESEGS